MNEHQSDPSAPELTLAEIKAIERGERTVNQVKKPADGQDKLKTMVEVLSAAKTAAAAHDEPEDASSMLNDLLQMGAGSEVPSLTLGGVAILESIESPFLEEPVNGALTITTLDTARALWAFAGGVTGAAPLLSALALESAADLLPVEYSTPLRVKAGELRGQWDANAIRALEQCGKCKAELDTEILVRLRDIFKEMEILK